MVSKDVLQYFFSILYQESGLILDESKKYLIETRLEPVAAQEGFNSIDALGRGLMLKRNPILRQKVVDAMTTNETSFFRDATPFTVMREEVLPTLLKEREKSKKIRIWCAASSTGQEPYSLAMMIDEMKPLLKGWDVQIQASDISEDVLKQARLGRYSQHEVQRGLSTPYMLKYFTQEGLTWHLKPEIKQMVRFHRLNLLSALSAVGEVDIVFCRNILIYFDLKTKQGVIERISELITPNGVLFLGGSEALLGIKSSLTRIEAKKGCYYRKNATPDTGSLSGGNNADDTLSELKRRRVCQT